MFKSYLTIAWRNIKRHKAYAAINIIGLTIGITCSIFILLWVQNEKSYDRFNKNANEIYRITTSITGLDAAVIPGVMLPELKEKLPVVKNMTRISFPQKQVIEVDTKKFLEDRSFYADTTFLQVFSFPLIEGNAATALIRPDAVILTRNMAKKYFGTTKAMGKILRVDNSRNVVVTGVLDNVPANAHFQFDFIMPISAIAQTENDLKNGDWSNFAYYGYLQLDKSFKQTGASISNLENQINKIYKEHMPKEVMTADFHLQPLTSIHLGSHYQADLPGHGNVLYVKILFLVAIFILAVACINFMNLATARSARRAKEVGLRKTVGAGRLQLIMQFLGESLFMSFLALLFSVLLVWLLLPLFNNLAGKQIGINFFDGKMILLFVGIALITGLVSGSYPALLLSSFKPVKVLKGEMNKLNGAGVFRNGLVVLQFVASIILLAGTIAVFKQLRFIKNMNIGFEKANLLYMPMIGDLSKQKEALKIALKENPNTSDFSIVGDLPTDILNASDDVKWDEKPANQKTMFAQSSADANFINVLGMKLLSGRNFFENSKADSNNYIINEKAAKAMGLTPQEALGKTITRWSVKGSIVGVVKDFNFKPIQQPIEPLVIGYNNGDYGIVVVRTKPGKTEDAIQALQKMNNTLNPATPFSFGFVDQDLANLYKGEQQMGALFNVFTILALFISCLGLYGLSAFLAEQRTKEIGVRKVLGASVPNIVYVLSLNFTKLVLIAILIAVPVSWIGIHKWLEAFAYKTEVGWIIFFAAALSALLVALITVSFESIKAATANPVKALRSE